MALLELLHERCPRLHVAENVPLKEHTTLRVGGETDFYVAPRTFDEVIGALDAARETSVPVLLLGGGSNLLVRDGGFRGLTVHLGKELSGLSLDGDNVEAMCGATLPALSRFAAENGLSGLEFAGGIPGSVGGAVCMNAGAYGGEIAQVLESALVYEDGERRLYAARDMAFGYRHSSLMTTKGVVLRARFSLKRGDRAEIERVMRDLAQKRRDKQPLEYPSAGSFFKRPEGYFAGALIERAGLKGMAVGGAQVSEKHAGFLINRGGARASDFLELMRLIQDRVRAMVGVTLETEVRIVGEDT